MDDEAYRLLQLELMEDPTAGAVIEGTGGLRKLRQADPRRGKGKRGGLRIINYWWSGGDQFWLFTVYDLAYNCAVELAKQQKKFTVTTSVGPTQNGSKRSVSFFKNFKSLGGEADALVASVLACKATTDSKVSWSVSSSEN